jgi:NADH dehydrogenase
MKRVLIIGGGFAGISALAKLSKWSDKIDIALIDQKEEFNFLPVLPDIIGRKINPRFLTNKLKDICRRFGAKFIKEEVQNIDLAKKEVSISSTAIPYDYLIVASGSETNFYNNEIMKSNSLKLDNVADAKRILQVLAGQNFSVVVISGGGYTGIEIASNIRKYFHDLVVWKRVIIVEKAPAILGPLPDWMKEYVSDNLKRLDIEVLTNVAIDKVEENRIRLSNGSSFENAKLIWTAGVKTGCLIDRLNAEKNRQGRVKVDQYLRLNESCFVVGDAALFSYKGEDLRMAIQFAIAQGRHAARNIINILLDKLLIEFKPLDLGYIIPMANNRSCGRVLGFNIKGGMATRLHYFMCIYRSWGFRNKIGILKDVIIRGGV